MNARSRSATIASLVACTVFPVTGLADTPAFDRPGIAFSTTTLPAGSFAWEQGLPDFTYDSGGGMRSRTFSADTNLRFGVLPNLELQVGSALWNDLDEKTAGTSNSENGFGDTRLSLKAALPSSIKEITWAALGGVTFATGDDAFTAGDPQYDLGVTAAYELSDEISVSVYVNFDRFRNETTWTFSPSVSYAVNDAVGVYLEAGTDLTEGDENGTVVGGGITYMITKTIQLDASVDFGVTSNSPDVTGGIGISMFFE